MTATLAVQVRPAPPLEPPTDDELRSGGWAGPAQSAPALPLEWPAGERAPTDGSDADRPRGGVAPHGDARPDEAAPDRSPARLATRRFLAVCLEVMGGYRPVTHLRALCAPEEFATIAQHLTGRTARTTPGRTHLAARTPVLGRPATGAPPRTGRAHQTGPAPQVVVRRVQLCEPREGVAEVAVVLGWRDTVWAAALRLEESGGRWLCTYLRTL